MHSPLIHSPGRVVNGMIHVVDWLPTLLQAAKGEGLKYQDQGENELDLDGIGMWAEIAGSSGNNAWPRQEVLLNIDPVSKFGGIIVGDHKLVYGNVPVSGWYPPPDGTTDDMEEKVDYTSSAQNTLFFRPEGKSLYSGPISIECGLMPLNATKECQPQEFPCLFNLKEDPCEYHNLASVLPELVVTLQDRLSKYALTMVPPGNKPQDPKGNPQLHGGVWKPWM